MPDQCTLVGINVVTKLDAPVLFKTSVDDVALGIAYVLLMVSVFLTMSIM
jgi:hypothetical protein